MRGFGVISAALAASSLSDGEYATLLEGILPRILPAGWHMADRTLDGAKYVSREGLSVIVSVAREVDDRRWLHVSCARPRQLPSYDDMKFVKETFVGRDRKAVQVFPPASEHVNIHAFCLHLFACLDGDVLPDFTHGTGTL